MIEIKNLYFKYENEFVLKNINAVIKEGSFIAIIGANGSGKTTLAKHLNGLLIPSRGEVIVDGIISKKNEPIIRKKVGFLFQNFEDQIVYPIVEDDISFGLENLGMEEHEIQKKVSDITKELNIEHLAKKNVNELSLGQKQLVALAGVLVMNPKYIVFDEPTTMLDIKNKKTILGIIKKLNNEGRTIILVTNSVDDLRFAKQFIALKNGSLFYKGYKKISILKGAI